MRGEQAEGCAENGTHTFIGQIGHNVTRMPWTYLRSSNTDFTRLICGQVSWFAIQTADLHLRIWQWAADGAKLVIWLGREMSERAGLCQSITLSRYSGKKKEVISIYSVTPKMYSFYYHHMWHKGIHTLLIRSTCTWTKKNFEKSIMDLEVCLWKGSCTWIQHKSTLTVSNSDNQVLFFSPLAWEYNWSMY